MADGDLMENGLREQTSSADKFMGWSTIWDRANAANKTPMMTRIWIGRLRLHIFWRGDGDPDCHDHPWDFWTFPLTPYVEEVAHYQRDTVPADFVDMCPPEMFDPTAGEFLPIPNPHPGKRYFKALNVVPAWKWTFRPAEYTHRVLGRQAALPPPGHVPGLLAHLKRTATDQRPIITIVWRSPSRRKWGFLKQRDGRWCWVAWREYVFGGGKGAPCE